MSYSYNEELQVLKIIEENGYYPYGLKHEAYNTVLNRYKAVVSETKVELKEQPGGGGQVALNDNINQYKFNGQELQDEFELNVTAMDWRQYDMAIGRFVCVDPVTHHSQSPYNAFDGNPILFADPSGADSIIYGMAGQSTSSNFHNRGNSSFGNANYGSGGGIFWGSEKSQFEQSFAGHLASGISTVTDKVSILSIYNHYAVQNKFTPYQPVGTLSTISYSSFQTQTRGGLNILLGYKDNGSGLSNFNYVQSIRTNVPLGGATSPYNDPQPADDNLPFYYTNAELPTFSNTQGYDVMFTDKPSRTMNNGTNWQAELSVVGMNGNGRYVPIYTISYGFNITNGAIILLPISYITPSTFHLNSF